MPALATNRLHESILGMLRPPSDVSIEEWCAEHILLPDKGYWNPHLAPWQIPLLRMLQDHRTRSMCLMASVQSAKTQLPLNYLCWMIANRPRSAMWVTSTGKLVRRLSKGRLARIFRNCKPVSEHFTDDRHDRTISVVVLDNMTLFVCSGNTLTELESDPIPVVFADESRRYPEGTVESLVKRMDSFPSNSLFVEFSTPDTKNDPQHLRYLDGTQHQWFFVCRKCKHEQKLVQSQLKWDTNEKTCPEGVYHWPELYKTIRYECSSCGERYFDVPKDRQYLDTNGRWLSQNANADPSNISVHWGSLLPRWKKFAKNVKEFLLANAAQKFGNIIPLKTWINETCGEPFEEMDIEQPILPESSRYEVNVKWSKEVRRYLLADVQKDHVWALCSAWSADGESRRLWAGRLVDLDAIREKQLELHVDSSRVGIDSGYDAPSVYRYAKTFGWIALKGEELKQVTATDKFGNPMLDENQKPIMACWKFAKPDPFIVRSIPGTNRVRLILWCVPTVMDILANLMRQMNDEKAPRWSWPDTLPEEFAKHLAAARKRVRIDAKGRKFSEWIYKKDDHLLDCCKMEIVLAMAGGQLKAALPTARQSEKIKEETPTEDPEE